MSAITPRTNQNILSEPTRPTRNLIAVLYAICGLLIAINLLGFVAFLRPALAGRSDFRIFYTAGYLIRTGNAHALYDEQKQLAVQNEKISYAPFPLLFNHAPYEALLFVPFSFLRYRYAYSAFGILNALLLLVVFKRIRRGNVAPGPNCRWMQLTLLCGFLPIFIALMQGQDSILMLVLFVICGQMLETRSDAKAGAILALALFKFQFVLPAAVLIGLRRSRFFAAFAATTFALAGISVCLVGISGAQSGLGMLLNMSTRLSGASQQAAYMVFPSAMANLRGFIETTLGGVLQHGSLQQLTAGLSIGMLVWCAFRIRGLANIVICAVLVSYHALPHDLSLLLIPISTLCARIAAGASFQPRRDLAFLTSLMCAPTILLFFGSRFFLYAIVLCAALIFFPRSFEQETRVEGPSAVAAG